MLLLHASSSAGPTMRFELSEYAWPLRPWKLIPTYIVKRKGNLISNIYRLMRLRSLCTSSLRVDNDSFNDKTSKAERSA